MSQRVVLVVLDGLRPDAIVPDVMPGLHRLGRRFWRAERATTIRPSVTVAALTSLATGVAPDTHGLIAPGLGSLASMRAIRPLPRELERLGIRTTAVVGDLAGGSRLIARTLLRMAGIRELVAAGPSARETVREAVRSFHRPGRHLTILYLNQVDQAGHQAGWKSKPYLDAAREIDLALQPLFALAEVEDTLLAITADHGGGGISPQDHDHPHPENDAIPLILAGPGVRARRVSRGPVGLLDIPPTILGTFGARVPGGYEGRVLTEAFAEARPGRPASAEAVA
ncbi:MAG: alkaline phosphatase family protein [Gemmatimonadales bacterium]